MFPSKSRWLRSNQFLELLDHLDSMILDRHDAQWRHRSHENTFETCQARCHFPSLGNHNTVLLVDHGYIPIGTPEYELEECCHDIFYEASMYVSICLIFLRSKWGTGRAPQTFFSHLGCINNDR